MAKKKRTGFTNLEAQFHHMHPEEKLEVQVKERKHPLSIGIPCEIAKIEKRIALRPEAVKLLTDNGYRILFEASAGNSAKYSDKEFADAGAKICYTPNEVFEADVVLKIAPPTLEEIGYMKNGKAIISALQTSTLEKQFFQELCKKQITALAFDLIEDKVGGLPIVRALSEIAGSTVMLIAAEHLSSTRNGQGIILGGITGVPPTKVVILGAGTVAEYAARTAMGLGAEVKVFDNHIYKMRRLKERLGQPNLFTSTIDSHMLLEALVSADVAVGAIRAEKGRAPVVVSEEMVAQMKPNSVIVDVSIDQGGCFETSDVTDHEHPTFRKFDVIHYCVPNIASGVARTASSALSNIFTPMFIQMADLGGIDRMIFSRKWFAQGVYAYHKGVTNKSLAEKFGVPYKDLNLIISATF